MATQTFGTFYDPSDHEGKPPLISHISAYVQGNYNSTWSGCVEITVEGTFGKDRNRLDLLRLLEMEQASAEVDAVVSPWDKIDEFLILERNRQGLASLNQGNRKAGAAPDGVFDMDGSLPTI